MNLEELAKKYTALNGKYPPFAQVIEAQSDGLCRSYVIRQINTELFENFPPTLADTACQHIGKWDGDTKVLIKILENAESRLLTQSEEHAEILNVQMHL